MFVNAFLTLSEECTFMRKIEYEALAEPHGEITGIILKLDGQEFELDKADVSHLEGIVTAVYDWMVDPFDVYLREKPLVRLPG